MPGRRREGPPGKLKAVARNWAQGRGGSQEPAADDPLTQAAAAFLTKRAAASAELDPEIAPEELPVVNLFLSLSTQWRRAGMAGVRVGLDYAAVPATAAMLDISLSPALLHDLRVMESEAVAVLAR